MAIQIIPRTLAPKEIASPSLAKRLGVYGVDVVYYPLWEGQRNQRQCDLLGLECNIDHGPANPKPGKDLQV